MKIAIIVCGSLLFELLLSKAFVESAVSFTSAFLLFSLYLIKSAVESLNKFWYIIFNCLDDYGADGEDNGNHAFYLWTQI